MLPLPLSRRTAVLPQVPARSGSALPGPARPGSGHDLQSSLTRDGRRRLTDSGAVRIRATVRARAGVAPALYPRCTDTSPAPRALGRQYTGFTPVSHCALHRFYTMALHRLYTNSVTPPRPLLYFENLIFTPPILHRLYTGLAPGPAQAVRVHAGAVAVGGGRRMRQDAPGLHRLYIGD